ncbi:hypothetical protein D3C81_1812310 [compost metagenome]
MLILGVDFQEGVGRQVLADGGEWQAYRGFALDPQIDGRYLVTLLHHGLVKVQLPIQFQGSRLHCQGARGGAGGAGLVEQAHADPQFAQPKCQHQPGGAGAYDQYVAAVHGVTLGGESRAGVRSRRTPTSG